MPDADTIDRLVRFRAGSEGPKPAVIDPSTRISYRELDATTRHIAAAFVEAGVAKGTRVGLIMPNGVRWVQVAVALTRVGAVLVPLSTLLRPRELVAQLRVASVQVLISVAEFRGHRYLDELELAAELGFDGISVNEHHQNAYGLMPSPIVMAAALSRRSGSSRISASTPISTSAPSSPTRPLAAPSPRWRSLSPARRATAAPWPCLP